MQSLPGSWGGKCCLVFKGTRIQKVLCDNQRGKRSHTASFTFKCYVGTVHPERSMGTDYCYNHVRRTEKYIMQKVSCKGKKGPRQLEWRHEDKQAFPGRGEAYGVFKLHEVKSKRTS